MEYSKTEHYTHKELQEVLRKYWRNLKPSWNRARQNEHMKHWKFHGILKSKKLNTYGTFKGCWKIKYCTHTVE